GREVRLTRETAWAITGDSLGRFLSGWIWSVRGDRVSARRPAVSMLRPNAPTFRAFFVEGQWRTGQPRTDRPFKAGVQGDLSPMRGGTYVLYQRGDKPGPMGYHSGGLVFG